VSGEVSRVTNAHLYLLAGAHNSLNYRFDDDVDDRYEARAASFDAAFAAAVEDGRIDVPAVTFLLVRGLYNWFGLRDEEIPYDLDAGVVSVDSLRNPAQPRRVDAKHTMVECPACGFEIGLTPSCDVVAVEIRGRRYERIQYTTYGGEREHTCPGCGISAPNFHDAGCRFEMCPACEGRARRLRVRVRLRPSGVSSRVGAAGIQRSDDRVFQRVVPL
jgi:hypothetical protein